MAHSEKRERLRGADIEIVDRFILAYRTHGRPGYVARTRPGAGDGRLDS
jgi:hypothetical protein